MTRVIALDLDGVLIPTGASAFSADAVAALRHLLAEEPSRVVVISTWRHVPELGERADAEFAAAGVAVAWADPDIPQKGAALADWLFGEYGHPGSWPAVVIVDDQAEESWLKPAKIIVPDASTGLTMGDVAKALGRTT